jgi:hypothetical protein
MPCGRRPSIAALTKKPAVSGLFRRVSTHQFAAFQATCSDDRTAWLAGSLSLLGPFRREKFALCAAGEVRS